MPSYRLVSRPPEELRYRNAAVALERIELSVRGEPLWVFRARKLAHKGGELVIHSAGTSHDLDFQLKDGFPCDAYSKEASLMDSLVHLGYAERLTQL